MALKQEDFVFAEHVLRRGFATEEQVEECLKLLERLRGEMELEESLGAVMLKKGYLAAAQVQSIERDIDPAKAGRPRNVIRGYQLQERIGSGAMGSVYRAHHLKLDIPVALKVLRLALSTSKTQIERLKREAQLAARLNHPNIVRSLDVGESTGFHYLAMEFVDGITVRDHIRKGPLPAKEALRIVREVARGLEHAHGQGVIHRDVKPGNIMLTRGGKVKLADFGLARGQEPSDLTLEHASIGTPQYLAPEQAIRGANATHRSDLFSLGASLYHMVTGHPPFSGENLGEIFQNVIQCRFAPPETVVKDLSLDTVYLIHRLMRAHPRERYPNATALLADLERLERDERIAPPDFKGDYRRFVRRRRTRRLAFGGTVAAAVAVAAWFGADFVRARSEARALTELCRALDRTGEARLGEVATLAQLTELGGDLAAARRPECRGRLPELEQRIEKVVTDLDLVDGAEQDLAAARGPEASFRTLHARVKDVRPQAYLAVTRTRLEEIETEIAELSRQERRARRKTVYAAPTREAAEIALAAFGQALRERYVETLLLATVEADLAAVKALGKAWDECADRYGEDFILAQRQHDYRRAHAILKRWRADQWEALRKHRLSGEFEPLFAVTDRQRRELETEERAYWTKEIDTPARRELAEGRAEEAEERVRPFARKAYEVRKEAQALLELIRKQRRTTREDQLAELRRLDERIATVLERRRYLDLLPLIAPERDRDHWIPEWQARLDHLHERAQVFDALYQLLTKRGFQPEADDPYVLVRRVKKGEERLVLKDADHERLAGVLALGDAGPDRIYRGYFLAAESFRDPDPRRRLAFVRDAIQRLPGNAWLPALKARQRLLLREVEERETNADTFFKSLQAARGRNDHVAALTFCRRLLNELEHTNFVEGHRKLLDTWRVELQLFAGSKEARIEASLPERNLFENVEDGTVVLRFTFEEWFPHGDADVPPGADKATWKERARRRFWNEWFLRRGVPDAEWPARYERASRQLLPFNDALRADTKRGGALLDGSAWANYWRWKGRRDREVKIITLENPFRDETKWRIDCVVSWDAPPGQETAPIYFALTAGDIQAGLLYAPFGWGGGRGARLFRQESCLADLEELFADFREPRDRDKRRKKLRKADRAYLDPWIGEVPYGMRLECSGREVRFYLAAMHENSARLFQAFDQGRHLLLRHRFHPGELAEAWDQGPTRRKKPFRFVSLARCRLHEVTTEGRLIEERR
ncbi:MAG: serine/threonine-protein kinase [Planctomycetota bacterium]|jgi:hypothetical protein